MELVIVAIGREVGMEPHEVRLKNLIPPEAMSFNNITSKQFDSGGYPESLRRAERIHRFPARGWFHLVLAFRRSISKRTQSPR